MAEYLRRELLLLQGQEASRADANWLETSEARTAYLTQQCILEEISAVSLSRELSLPENVGKENGDLDGAFRSDGLFGLDDGCNVSDQDRAQCEGVMMEVSNALIARVKRWQERIPQLAGGSGGRLEFGRGSKVSSALVAETEALQAMLEATKAHLALIDRMKDGIEEGILNKQDKIDKTEFMLAITRAKAAILKLQSLEYHFLSATYKAEDVVALNKIWDELTTRIQSLRTQLSDAQKRLAVFRGLGPAFHDQLAQFRDVQRRLLDAQYMLENFNKINSELEDGAVDMILMGGGSHLDHDDGGFVVY
ncbi:hypothetical protein VOLCADRAFT_102922 [Volvox carteri f. nagariensis]|uniref:Uncharacterized protein n=1 Tax=Volvox carteri f. nagariensis TaxID=3068 RepID=D8TGV0_VOLCA|nr:uncharacterized protein VOLCADRAFT_102922 [Volvox carteri f. nagariensis]EFJ52963.1 hypothetical protein VOLCADRAFT_102922 [Volvox carteri f. nagariensis]|eukprot:XP_002945968.1 hypothetical protein VOLCADRAFT_102922 [Volvox carteri f. nagariensis]